MKSTVTTRSIKAPVATLLATEAGIIGFGLSILRHDFVAAIGSIGAIGTADTAYIVGMSRKLLRSQKAESC